MNRLQALHDAGQSIWLDFIDRTMLFDGDLERRIRDDSLTGMTSNPTIFEKALAEGTEYDSQLAGAPAGLNSWQLFEMIATDDVRTACDHFMSVYEATNGQDGFVSIEVSPGSANDTEKTVVEAERLWRAVDRPNVMIKVPGTVAGAAAVRRLIAAGVNVNITLLFSLDAHRSVIEAYQAGLADRLARREPIDRVASVASFFVSRVDTEVDKRLDAAIAKGTAEESARLRSLKGTIAIANAKLAYALFRERFAGDRWNVLAREGAQVQRPLWASTSTKNPDYRDVMYVEQLIGADTVNTMTPATIDAFRDHGVVTLTAGDEVESARSAIADLETAGISLESVTDKLLLEGLTSFTKSFESLLKGLEGKVRSLGGEMAGRAG
ncbi:MAG: transaldolase [Anaerolineae bacterium]|nr:transaldolase [Gemmatimonadaceae bacterium]